MTLAAVISAVLFLLVLTVHRAVLIRVHPLVARGTREFTVACVAVGTLHLAEVGAFAAGLSLGQHFGIGSFDQPMSAMDIFDFSVVNFTTLGLGSAVPTGHLRFIAGVEAFTGFLCISMSASMLLRGSRRRADAAEAQPAAGHSVRKAGRALDPD